MQQWIDLYARTHKAIRADSTFNESLLRYPGLPFGWLPTRKTNGLPIGSPKSKAMTSLLTNTRGISRPVPVRTRGQLATTLRMPTHLCTLLDSQGLPHAPMVINDYASYAEMLPAGAAW